MKIVRDNLLDGAFSSQSDLVETLFSSCQGGDTFGFEAGQVSKWMNGLLKVSPTICSYYSTFAAHREQMAVTMKDAILPSLSDPTMVMDRVQELLERDTDVSENKKQELCALRSISDAEFLAAVLIFGMSRPFIARDIRKPEKNQNGTKSPSVQDYIFDADAPKPCRNFCGRDAELATLHEALEKIDKVFLQGIPGIGKSEIAKAYAKLHKKDYTNILYFIYSGSLHRDIADLQFADDKETEDEEKRFQRHNRFLRTLKKDTLLIIDNFNTTTTRDALLSVVLKYKCRILFTTKSNFSDHSQVIVEEIEDKGVLSDLFCRLFHDAPQYKDTVEEIMEIVHYHTLSVELAARLLQSGMLTPEQVLEKLREEKAAYSGTDLIRITKDGETKKATYYDHIETLFALFRLSQKQGYAMQCMSMMPLSGIESRLFAKWAGFTDMNVVNELVELGFIHGEDDRVVSLHPMMQDVTVADLKPSTTSCQTMLINIGDYCHRNGVQVSHPRLIKQIAENTIRLIDKKDLEFYRSFLEQVYLSLPSMNGTAGANMILAEIDRLLQNSGLGTVEDRVALLRYKAREQKTADEKIAYLTQAIETFPAVTEENAPELYLTQAELAEVYRQKHDLDHARQFIMKAMQLASRYDEIHSDKNGTLGIIYACILNDSGGPQKALELLGQLEVMIRKTRPNTFEHAAVMRKLAAITANCGDIDKGFALLAESRALFASLCGDDEELMRKEEHALSETEAGLKLRREHPDRFITAL